MVREDEEVDAGGPGSGAKDGDPLGISAKVANVLVEPAQGLDLVQEAIVPLCRLITGTEETWGVCRSQKEEGVGDEENKKRRETHISISEGRIYHLSGKCFLL